MATPMHDKDYEKRKQEAQELIAAGGCSAIKLWSATDAERLCPKDHIKDVKFEPLEAPVYITEWLDAAKKAVELINRGIFLLQPVSSEPAKESRPSIEELKDFWDKGYVRGCEEVEAKFHEHDSRLAAPNFSEYLLCVDPTAPPSPPSERSLAFLEWLDGEIKAQYDMKFGHHGASLEQVKRKYLSLHAQPNPEPSVASIRKDAIKVMGQIRKKADLEYQKSMNNNPHDMGVAEGIDWCMRMMDTVPFLFRDKEGFSVPGTNFSLEPSEEKGMRPIFRLLTEIGEHILDMRNKNADRFVMDNCWGMLSKQIRKAKDYFTLYPSPPSVKPEREDALVAAIVRASVGTREQCDIITEHMKEYFKRWPSYYPRLTDLEWYHLFLDFLDAIESRESPAVQQEDGEVPQFTSIWDASEAFKKAAEEYYAKMPISPNALLEKNHNVVRRAAAEWGATWMRKALEQELKDQKAKQRDIQSKLSAREKEINQLNEWRKEGKAYKEMLEDKLTGLDKECSALRQEKEDYRSVLERIASNWSEGPRYEAISVLDKYTHKTHLKNE